MSPAVAGLPAKATPPPGASVSAFLTSCVKGVGLPFLTTVLQIRKPGVEVSVNSEAVHKSQK